MLGGTKRREYSWKGKTKLCKVSTSQSMCLRTCECVNAPNALLQCPHTNSYVFASRPFHCSDPEKQKIASAKSEIIKPGFSDLQQTTTKAHVWQNRCYNCAKSVRTFFSKGVRVCSHAALYNFFQAPLGCITCFRNQWLSNPMVMYLDMHLYSRHGRVKHIFSTVSLGLRGEEILWQDGKRKENGKICGAFIQQTHPNCFM